MKPLPSEVIAGVRRILKETIEPELTSGHALSRLQDVRAVLAQVDWDDATFALVARNRALVAVLDRVNEWRAADAARSESIPRISPARVVEARLAEHQATYRELSAAVVGLVDPLQDWLTSHPDDLEAHDLQQALLETL